MINDPENTVKEAPTSGETQTSNEDRNLKCTNGEHGRAAAENPSVAVSEELMAKIVDLCERNSEAAITLNKKLNDLTQNLKSINDEIESNKPLRFQGEVTGFYNFDKREKEIVDEYHLSQKEHAKNLFARARSKFPSA